MKIVNRKEFLEMPRGTVYSKYEPTIFDELCVKMSDSEDGWGNDWIYLSLTDGFIKGTEHDVGDLIGLEHFEFDMEGTVRDGLFDNDQLFAVYDENDILKLIAKLTYFFLEKSDNPIKLGF